MDSSKYISLLVKKFKGKLDDQDAAALNQWLAGNDQKQTAKQIERAWELSSHYKSTYEPDVEAGLARFKNKIKQEDKRAHTGGVVDINRRRFTMAWAAAIAVLVLALGWWWKSTSNADALFVSTSMGEQKEFELPDGSLVVLNEASTLDFSSFNDKNRTVQFSGEAYFDIERDPENPFVIQTEGADVRVLGTSFNLRAYQAETFTEVEVESGQVELVEKEKSERLLLNANDRGVCMDNGAMTSNKVDYLNAMSWRTQSLAFRNTPLQEVIPYLERHFKIKIDIEEPLRQCPVTSDFKALSKDIVFLTIERIFNAQVEQSDITHYVIKGNGC